MPQDMEWTLLVVGRDAKGTLDGGGDTICATSLRLISFPSLKPARGFVSCFDGPRVGLIARAPDAGP